MPRLTPLHWRALECVFLKAGFSFVRQTASHRVYGGPGILRPLIIPEYEEVGVEIISGLLRTAKLDRETFFRLLEGC